MENDYTSHYSVMNSEVIDYFEKIDETNPDSEFYLDLTFGGGGHSLAILDKVSNSKVIAFDQDQEAYEAGVKKVIERGFEDRFLLINTNFSNLSEQVEKIKSKFPNFSKFRGAVFDLGVSSHHFDKSERGFSFQSDGPLDMRMDTSSENETAADVVNNYDETELTELFFNYGEEKFSRTIAKNIIEKRKESPILRTKVLEDIIFHSYPKKARHGRTNPSTRCFQALRIHVNDELNVLTDTLPQVFDLMAEGGRIAVISFHSLEDRIAKVFFKKMKAESKSKVLTKKPQLPSEEEIKANKRSRSAKLRVLEK